MNPAELTEALWIAREVCGGSIVSTWGEKKLARALLHVAEWKPIKDAPRDENGIIGFFPTHFQNKGGILTCVELKPNDWRVFSQYTQLGQPTLYLPRPLPPPPEVTP